MSTLFYRGGGVVLMMMLLTACVATSASATPTPSPSATVTREPSPLPPYTVTPDRQIELLLTQQSILLTQQALLLATDTMTPMPNLTQTAAVCRPVVTISEQSPADGRYLVVGARVTKTLTLKNTGDCVTPTGMMLVESVAVGQNPPLALAIGAIPPGETVKVQFEWIGPAAPGVQKRTLELRLAEGTRVGEPWVLTFNYVSKLQATPTDTPLAATATPTATPAAPLTNINVGYANCRYAGPHVYDYTCDAYLTLTGGGGPFTVWIDEVVLGTFAAGKPIVFDIVYRRCLGRGYNVRVFDEATQVEIKRDFYFDPPSNASLFPDGGCVEYPEN